MRGRHAGRIALFPLGFAVAGSSCDSNPRSANTGLEGVGNGGGGAATSSTSMGGGASTTTGSSSGGAPPLTCEGTPHSTVPVGECDLLAQDCAAGSSCEPAVVSNDATTACTPRAGLKGAATPCIQHRECQPGLFCFGVCTPACCPDSNEPCGYGICDLDVIVEPSATAKYSFRVCEYQDTCTLFVQDACAPGTECHIRDTVQGIAMCAWPSGANRQEGEACEFNNDCGDMQLCFLETCRYNCSVSTSEQEAPGLGGCPTGQSCSSYFDFGIDDVGVCTP